eukprot:361902-Chlamydomonas_euryale.AAC.2
MSRALPPFSPPPFTPYAPHPHPTLLRPSTFSLVNPRLPPPLTPSYSFVAVHLDPARHSPGSPALVRPPALVGWCTSCRASVRTTSSISSCVARRRSSAAPTGSRTIRRASDTSPAAAAL